MDFVNLIDVERVEKAKADLAALDLAVRDAEVEAAKASEACKSAADAAQSAANAGADVDKLLALEAAVDMATRRSAVAQRMLIGAQTRHEAGVRKQANEVKQAHAVAIASITQHREKLLADAHAVLGRLQVIDSDFRAAHDASLKLHRSGGLEPQSSGPSLLSIFSPADPTKLIRVDALATYLFGWNSGTGKFSWMTE